MSTNSPSLIISSRQYARTLVGLLLSCALLVNAHGATSLATEPFTSSDSIRALPNVMFVLDDSGSMNNDFLPDWAGEYVRSVSGDVAVITPVHRFFNNAYNGVAYNPGTRYRPPVMYTSAGALDTTTYPSMTGVSVVTGGDNTATAASPNWKAVKSDGYGIQSINGYVIPILNRYGIPTYTVIPTTGVTNLEGNAFSYTTIPGEFCDSEYLRNCSTTADATYKFPAKLRWCTTPEKAIASTAASNTYCQAGNVDSTAANLTAGVTHYTFPRMPGSSTAVIKFEAFGTVTGITVAGQQILSASASKTTPAELVVEIAKKINACTLATSGACTVAGYSAISTDQGVKIRTAGTDVLTYYVTIFAPATTSATPVVTGGGSPTSYAFGTVPGSVLLTQIDPLVTSYPYPGTAIKGENRKDCAGTTCTYAEEMTNYANWYAYYRTRMQMMKTASSIAFSGVDEKFRVGYFSINNTAGTQFLNVAPFDGTQKNLWYSKFLSAKPSGETPLRLGLSNAGRYFANKPFQIKAEEGASATFSTMLNGVSATDPMQYSCQQNFTILSTDGYWDREGVALQSPRRLDDTTKDIGQQDNNLNRPWYDGGTWTKASSQTLWHEEQWGLNEFLIKSMTQQQQTSTESIKQVVTTTTTYPYKLVTTPLQTRVTPLMQTDSYLNQTEYPLYRTPTVLTRYTQYYRATTEPLNIYTRKLRERTAKLNKTAELRVVKTSTPLQASNYKITATETNLIQTTYLITKVTSQLQKNSLISTTGGDSWNWTGYADATSCTSRANSLPADDLGAGVLVREVLCRYVTISTDPAQSSCTITAPSGGPVFNVVNPVACTYETGTTSVVIGSYSNSTAPKQTSTANNAVYATAKTYAYATTANAPQPGLDNCTAVAQTTAPYQGPSRSCDWDASLSSATDVTSGTCTNNTPIISGTGVIVKTVCGYTGTPAATTVDTCTVARSAGSPYSVLTRVDCAYPAGDGTANAASDVANCTQQTSKATATTVGTTYSTYRTCAFVNEQTTSPAGGNDSCTWSGGQSGNVFTSPRVRCDYLGAALVSSNQSSCTYGVASTGTSPTTEWNKYTTCSFGNASTPANQNLSACSGSGGVSGSDYTGPRVTCSYMPTLASQVDSTCTASGTEYVTPLVTCGYAASGAATLVVGTCTESATGAIGATCAYGTGVPSNNVGSCNIVSQTPVAGVYTGPARDCVYADQTAQSITGSCTVKAKDTGTLLNGPATACAYGSMPASYTPATTTPCVPVPQTGFVGPAVECAYNGTATETPMGSDCATYAADPGGAFDILAKKVCVPGDNTTITSATTDPIALCDISPWSDGQPATETRVSTATECTYNQATVQDTPTCTASGGIAGNIHTTRVTCPVTNPAKNYVAVTSCALKGSLNPDVFDANGTIVDCTRTDIRGTAMAFEFVPSSSCPGGEGITADASLNQTECKFLVNTTPVPADPAVCTGDVPAVAPSYKSTFCTPVSIPTVNATNCTDQSPVAPQWITTICSSNDDGTKNTLADVAAYYYYHDLRTPALNNCTGAIVPPAPTGTTLCSTTEPMNNVFTTTTDTSPWQHMTTYTLGLGASGYMQYTDKYLTATSGDYLTVYGVDPHGSNDSVAANPATGVCSWQSSGACNWPYPSSNEQTTVDDLWHAGVNGHGAYFSATNPDTLSKSIVSALEGIQAAGGATAAPALSTAVLVPADSYVFSSTYKSVDWTGELTRRTMDPYTAIVSTTVDWAVQGKLDAKSPASRNIYTFDSSVATTQLKEFTSGNFSSNTHFLEPYLSVSPAGLTQFLCASADTCLSAANKTLASGANLIDYLRGVRTYEGAVDDNNKYYRERQHVLGDMVNAQAIYVNKPQYSYGDPGYSAFVTAQSARQAVVYAGANDGMLHAFAAKGSAATEAAVEAAAAASSAASLDPTSSALATAKADTAATAINKLAIDTLIGQELWAYIPSMVMPNLYKLADKKYKDQHRYFVDATPLVADICISNCTSDTLAAWRTILVGGLGGGGHGYYALDVTNPTSPKALWEFTNANLGYSYGNPQVAKLSDGTWVVLVTSGYNNIPDGGSWTTGDGVGRLFVINAQTGALIRTISTGVGDTSNPSGLSKITAQVVNPSSDNTIEAVYGGDLLGNLWRFDVNDTIGAAGYDAQLLAVLKDASGKPQPVTTKPEVALIPDGNVMAVYVGTGRFLHPDDISDTSQQSLYAIKDARATGTTSGTAIYDNPGGDRTTTRSTLGFIRQVHSEIDCPTGTLESLCVAGEKVRTSTNNPVDFVLDSGWYVDLLGPSPALDGKSERANTDPALALGLLAFNTNVPSLDSCDIGGKSYSYYLNYLTGGPIYAPGNGNPALNNGVVGKLLAGEFASAPALVVTKGGKLIEVSGRAGGGIDVKEPPLPPPASTTRRTSWRELIRD